MIEENWIDVTLYNVHALNDVHENTYSFLFHTELEKTEIFKILISYYGNEFKEDQLVIDELVDVLQLSI